jgi:hypothetical protein
VPYCIRIGSLKVRFMSIGIAIGIAILLLSIVNNPDGELIQLVTPNLWKQHFDRPIHFSAQYTMQ